jgi:hypothetical protein
MLASSATKRSSRDKVRAHRARLRRQSLKPVQFWLPDVRSRGFKLAAHKQSLAVARSRHAAQDQAYIEAVTDWGSN